MRHLYTRFSCAALERVIHGNLKYSVARLGNLSVLWVSGHFMFEATQPCFVTSGLQGLMLVLLRRLAASSSLLARAQKVGLRRSLVIKTNLVTLLPGSSCNPLSACAQPLLSSGLTRWLNQGGPPDLELWAKASPSSVVTGKKCWWMQTAGSVKEGQQQRSQCVTSNLDF